MKFNFDVFGDESESYNLIFARLSAMPPARHSYRPPGVFIEFSHLSFMSFLLPEWPTAGIGSDLCESPSKIIKYNTKIV